jgi:hypothetical protein
MPEPADDPTGLNLVPYDEDVVAWSEQQSALLRAGDFAALDVEHVAEEIESVGSSHRHEVRRRLARLVQHLLKWQHQPGLRGRSWRTTIGIQRKDLLLLLKDSPSLRPRLGGLLLDAYPLGRDWAELETGLLNLSETCPFSVEQLVDPDFFPE